jgi:hypothetical protein
MENAPTKYVSSRREYVAALGILVLELEAGESAEWAKDDIDWENGKRSNQVRLGRLLEEWKDMRDAYRHVGEACHNLELLVETFEHEDVDDDLKYQAVVYKCIVEPLFQILYMDHGSDTQLFESIPSPRGDITVSTSQLLSKVAKRELFDDFEEAESDEK